ncbi:MAG: hypothetical protein J1D77_06785 [Muribaculaceae bacterium]|nr:hypothetical protein [Muribaculaceae bacterium]
MSFRGRHIVAFSVVLIFLVFILDTGIRAYAQSQRKNEIKAEENYGRPEPTRPIEPEVPGVNRYQEDKIFLEYADSLYKQSTKRDTIERQILKGNVKFRQSGMWMYCDSAYYYPEENSLDAFSNVRMEQGDTLFVYADKLFYDGDLHLAKLKNGPTRNKVTLINKDVTLTTDSLDYDMNIDLGWYTKWGTIDDKVNTLTSLYGEYSPATKRAEFFHDVVLVNNKDGFTMLTDTLFYSTETHIAEIESRTIIQGENDTIITNLATYYTDTGDADLLSRSLIIHRDSTGNVTTLEGDSIIYDNATRISRAYMFQDPFKRSNPMVITDTAQKTTLIGGFGIYNDSTKEALATIYPLLMEYSRGDTLFLRADTIKTYIVTHNVVDKRRKTKSGFPEFNGVPIVRADSGFLWIDTTFFKVTIPYVETPLVMLLKAAPPYKKPEPAVQPETLANSEFSEPIEAGNSVNFIDSITAKLPIAISKDSIATVEEIADLDSIGVSRNLDNFIKSIEDLQDLTTEEKNKDLSKIAKDTMPDLGLDSNRYSIPNLDEDILQEFEKTLASENGNDTIGEIEKPFVPDSIPVETHVALAYHRARFFKQDMQGVADSMVFVERDSMLYMFRKPIVWSGERQVTGNRIDVHFNDSTADWALLPEYGLMSEHVDEDFYNQIYGKEIKAYFSGQGLRRLEVDGSVETIFLPQEEDSTYNRLVNAESSYLDAYLTENQLDRLKMWPEVSGSVTPIFLVKRTQMYLQKFKWWGFLRPEREWYGDRIRWADNLGEVPEDLEQYFLSPSDFGEPKSFSGTRFTPPPTSLPQIVPSPLDTLDLSPEFLDSLGVSTHNLLVPDSLQTGVDSPGVLNVEKHETLEDIEDSESEENQEAEAVEEEAKDIEREVEINDPTEGAAIIKEEEEEKEVVDE